MPCRDYDDNVRVVDNTRTYQDQRDKLARIACMAMTLLEEKGITLKNEEAQTWWAQHKIADAKEEAKKAAVAAVLRKKELAELARLEGKYRGRLGK